MRPFPGNFPPTHQRRAGMASPPVLGSALVASLLLLTAACSPDVTVVVAPTTVPTTKISPSPSPSPVSPTDATTTDATITDATPGSASATTGPLQPGGTAGTPATTVAPGTPTTIVGSGTVTERVFPLDGFRGVSASHGFRVTVTVAETFSVTVAADDNAFERLDVRVEDDTLVLGVLPETTLDDVTLTATVTLPALVAIDGAGGSVFGASGPCDDLSVSLSGGSELDAAGLICRSVETDMAGGSRADVTASDAVQASLSGGSELHLRRRGVAAVDQHLGRQLRPFTLTPQTPDRTSSPLQTPWSGARRSRFSRRR